MNALSIPVKFHPLVLVFFSLCSLAGCCGDDDPIHPPPLDSDGGTTAPEVPSTSKVRVNTASKTRVEMEGPESETTEFGALRGNINIKIHDFQLFHPDSTQRALSDLRDLENISRIVGGGDFAIGLVLEAQNESVYLLESPRIISDLSIVGEHGLAPCKVSPRTGTGHSSTPVLVLSPQVSQRTPWTDEERDILEAPWRPQETIRISVLLSCGTIHIHDLSVTGVEGFINVVARAPFTPLTDSCSRSIEICEDDVVGTAPGIELPGRVVSLRQVTLDGNPAYVAGDLVIRAEGGRVVRDVLRDHELSLDSSLGEELPDAPAPIRQTSDEWSMNVTSVRLQHWLDAPGAPKGSRIVTVSAQLNIDTGAIEGRLRAAVESARQAYERAQAAVRQARGESPDELRRAESSALAASAELARAQSTFARSQATEAGRLARLLSCDRVELVTHRRNVRAANALEVGTECRELAARNTVEIVWSYVVGRYEIPLGITYSLGIEPQTSFFAASSLTMFDPR